MRRFRDGNVTEGDEADGAVDYLPHAGSLVLFHSCKLEHEVTPTSRERTCLIGWWLVPAEFDRERRETERDGRDEHAASALFASK